MNVNHPQLTILNHCFFQCLWILLSGLLLCGCGGSKNNTQSEEAVGVAPDMHTSKNSLDWSGTYLGVIPCADCLGIVRVLELNADDSYQLSSEYLGKAKERVVERGNFNWSSDGGKVILDDEKRYWINENAVVMLNWEGQRIERELSHRYRLSKTEVGPLSGKVPEAVKNSRWEVYWVNGMDWGKEEQGKAHFSISDTTLVSGEGPCNFFQAEAKMPATQVLRLGEMAATKRACPQLKQERDYFSALGTVEYYFVFDSQIALFDAKYRPLILGRQKSND